MPVRSDDTLILPEVIHRPDLQSRFQRSFSSAIAVVGWAVWVYILLPLFTFLAWFVDIHLLRHAVFEDSGHGLSTLLVYAAIIVCSGGSLLLWACYNIVRHRYFFSGNDARQSPAPVGWEQLSKSFSLDCKTVASLQNSRITWLEHDEQGTIIGVEYHHAKLEPVGAESDNPPVQKKVG